MTFSIRDAARDDLPGILAVECSSFVEPWSESMFRVPLSSRLHIFQVAAREMDNVEDDIIGFVIAQVVVDSAEIVDIAVVPELRGKGIGAALLDSALARCRDMGVHWVTLEVRESNLPARALYGSRGFVAVGRRAGYYRLPLEDGLIFRLDFPVNTGKREILQ